MISQPKTYKLCFLVLFPRCFFSPFDPSQPVVPWARTVHLSKHAGHLVRTKASGVDEGGVAAGFAVISSLVGNGLFGGWRARKKGWIPAWLVLYYFFWSSEFRHEFWMVLRMFWVCLIFVFLVALDVCRCFWLLCSLVVRLLDTCVLVNWLLFLCVILFFELICWWVSLSASGFVFSGDWLSPWYLSGSLCCFTRGCVWLVLLLFGELVSPQLPSFPASQVAPFWPSKKTRFLNRFGENGWTLGRWEFLVECFGCFMAVASELLVCCFALFFLWLLSHLSFFF